MASQVLEHPRDLSEGDDTDLETRHERDVLNVYLSTSRDALNWDLSWIYEGIYSYGMYSYGLYSYGLYSYGLYSYSLYNVPWIYKGRPIIERGPAGSWWKDGISTTSEPTLVGQKHMVYFSGMAERHEKLSLWQTNNTFGSKIGAAWFEYNRFAFLESALPNASGHVLTKPFTLACSQLTLNLETRAAVHVILKGVGASVCEAVGGEVTGPQNGFDVPVAWSDKQGSFDCLWNGDAQLEFVLPPGSRLYAFSFTQIT